jgi:hypothetical protein
MPPVSSYQPVPCESMSAAPSYHCPEVSESIFISCRALVLATFSQGKVKATSLRRTLKFVKREDQSRLTTAEHNICIQELESLKKVLTRTGTSALSGKITKIGRIIEEIHRRANADPDRAPLSRVSNPALGDLNGRASALIDRYKDIQVSRENMSDGSRIKYEISLDAAKRALERPTPEYRF